MPSFTVKSDSHIITIAFNTTKSSKFPPPTMALRPPFMTNFSVKTSKELRAFARTLGLPTAGRKQDLLARLTIQELGVHNAPDGAQLISRCSQLWNTTVREMKAVLRMRHVVPIRGKWNIVAQILLSESSTICEEMGGIEP
jgi:hypothetical protein